jgi:8-oxo-dGTP pyrophosphatase MutT (NUDIX family)
LLNARFYDNFVTKAQRRSDEKDGIRSAMKMKSKGGKAVMTASNRALANQIAAPPHQSERRQVAALPYRRTPDGGLEILLVTSRETKRFIIPKGWPMCRLSDFDAAAQEAREEAGVVGKVKRKAIGSYVYWKRLEQSFELLKVDVFPLEVLECRAKWKEKSARECHWLSPAEAWLLIDEPGLADIVRKFDGT